jgi:transposase InsO family protein
MNHKKLRRLYREERLQVRRRFCRKRAVGTRAPIAVPQGANQRWSIDFASDALSDGRRFRILTIVDNFTRECLALIADTSLSGLRVVLRAPSRWVAEPHRLKSTWDSAHRWMKEGAQVTSSATNWALLLCYRPEGEANGGSRCQPIRVRY